MAINQLPHNLTQVIADTVSAAVSSAMQGAMKELAVMFNDFASQTEERIDRKFAQFEERFEGIDGRFAQIDKRFAQIDKRFNQIDAHFFAIESRMATKQDLEQFVTEAEFDDFKVTLDKILANTEVNTDERLALSVQVTHHDDWIVEAAPAVGIPYQPGSGA